MGSSLYAAARVSMIRAVWAAPCTAAARVSMVPAVSAAHCPASPCPAPGSDLGASGAGGFSVGDACDDDSLGVGGGAPADDFDPLVVFQILVVLEEVLDLLDGDLGKLQVVVDLIVAPGEARDRHRHDLLVDARL